MTMSFQPDYREVHRLRFQLSLEWLAPYLGPDVDVLELGGASPFTGMLGGLCKAVGIVGSDLRYAQHMASDFWDVVLCMEVIEHIGDTDGLHTEWAGDGVQAMLKEAARLMKPKGILFLTTPNAASITAIHHGLRLEPPMIFRPHVREYVPYELDAIVRQAGFNIIRRETLDVWRNAISETDHAAIKAFMERRNYPLELRGEDIFLLARRL